MEKGINELIKIEVKDFDRIKNIVEISDDVTLSCNVSPMGNNILLNSIEDETYLYFKKNSNEIIISNIYLKNKKIETMTKILKEIILISQKYNLSRVIVESVLTQEMYEFCMKNNFQKDEAINSYFNFSNEIYGNYYLNI